LLYPHGRDHSTPPTPRSAKPQLNRPPRGSAPIRQATAVTGNRRTRYRGLGKTHLEHVYSAVALNLIRLDAWWNGQPLDHTRTSHLARLDLTLAA
ncbi:hypothetical protein ABZ698_41200, partial [Streptomyces antibioticus]